MGVKQSGIGKSVTRRKAIGAAASATAVAAIATPAIAQGQPEISWRLTSSFPRSLKGCFAGVTRFTQRVAEMTDGKFKIQYFAPGEIVGGLQALDATRSGSVEICHTAPYFYVGQSPVYAFGTALPFGLNTRQQNTWLYKAGGLDKLQAFKAKQGVFYIPFGNTCSQAAGWFRKEINTAADFQGLRMRIPGIGGQVLSRLGGVPQQIAPGDVYQALERGSIDAAELSGPYDDENAGFHRVAKFYYYPGWQEVSAGTCIYVNKAKWDDLPAHYKSIVLAAAADGEREMISDYDLGNIEALRRLAAAGVQFRRFPAEVLDALYKAAEAYLDEVSKNNAEFAAIYKDWSEFRKNASLWYSIAETPNDAFIQRVTRS
jgi:TRAP-type mannitol/chloroaromatic compound transport system substrate-binding protein